MAKVRLLPSEARRRGFPAVGYDLIYGGDGVDTEPVQPPALARVVETAGGAVVGRLTLEVVQAGLIIDRDGVLAQLVQSRTPDGVPYAVTLDAGASGFRADVVDAGRELPYRSCFALADIGGQGALIVTVESAAPAWPLGAAMLATLRVFTRDADARAPSQSGESFVLPLVKPSGS